MFKWGENELRVRTGSYSAPYPAVTIAEIDLIPAGTEFPSTTIQEGGRGRRKPSLSIKTDIVKYNTLYLSHLSSEEKQFDDPYGNSFNCKILSISPPTIKSGWLECDITFIEV